jgi:hypothetical protein
LQSALSFALDIRGVSSNSQRGWCENNSPCPHCGEDRKQERIMKRRLDRVMLSRLSKPGADDDGFAVEFATFQATPKGKAKLRPPDAAARFAIEKARQQRRFCNAFALWRSCRNKACHRQGACCGDSEACLKRGLARVPYDLQWRVRRAIIAATPHNIGAPERAARQCMPGDLYE